MDKYELVFDIVEHPENYSTDRLREILSDPEIKEIYTTLCKTDSAVNSQKTIDTDTEWRIFTEEKLRGRRRVLFGWGTRAASIIALVGTSIVAVAAGIAVTVAVSDRPSGVEQVEASENGTATLIEQKPEENTDSVVAAIISPTVFEDDSLETILEAVAATYGANLRFNDVQSASLHLYYRFDPSLTLEEVISDLNTFEHLNITLNGNTIIVD